MKPEEAMHNEIHGMQRVHHMLPYSFFVRVKPHADELVARESAHIQDDVARNLIIEHQQRPFE